MGSAHAARRKAALTKENLPLLIGLPLVFVYYEFLLKAFAERDLGTGRWLLIVLFSASLGLAWQFIGTFFRSKRVNRIIITVMLSVTPIIYLLEFFLKRAYKFYYSVGDILFNAKQVAGSYGGEIVSLVLGGIGPLLLYFVPLVLFLVFGHFFDLSKKSTRIVKVGTGAASVFLYLLALIIVLNSNSGAVPDSQYYRSHFAMDESTTRFGLMTSLRLDIQYGIFGVPAESGDVGDMNDVSIMPPSSTETPSQPSSDPSSGPDQPIEYGKNEMDIDFAALAAGETDKTLKSMHEYFGAQTASSKNKYTGYFKDKNLIFIVAEAFSPCVIDKDLTPTLYRLANTGFVFENYYQPAWGESTSGGEYSVLLGQIPKRQNESEKGLSMYLGRKNNWYFSMGNALGRQNYLTLAFHNNTYDYYSRDLTHNNLGYLYYGIVSADKKKFGREYTGDYSNPFAAYYEEDVRADLKQALLPNTQIKSEWPRSDLEMFNTTLPYYIDHQPFHVYYMTVSGHNNYSFNAGNKMAMKNQALVQHLPYSDTVKAYYACNMELENALASMVASLEQAGIADDTVIVLTNDHYPYGLDKDFNNNPEDYFAELIGMEDYSAIDRDRSALIVWSGCMEEPVPVSEPCYSIDILPTLLNLFGVEFDSRLFPGRDVFSDADPLVIFANFSWITDKGTYNAANNTFTLAPGATADAKYIKDMTSIAKKKVLYSRYIRQKNYYQVLFG